MHNQSGDKENSVIYFCGGPIAGRSREVASMVRRRKVNVCAVQETRFRKEGMRLLKWQ